MKILIISPFDPELLNGISKYIKYLSLSLKENHIHIEILTFKRKISKSYQTIFNGIKIYYYPTKKLFSYFLPFNINTYFYTIHFLLKFGYKYDLIHTHSYPYLCSLYSIILSKFLHKPSILTLHGGIHPKNYLTLQGKFHPKTIFNKIFYFLMGKIQFSLSDALISVSKSDILQINKKFLCKRIRNNFFIPNGVKLEQNFKPAKERKYISFIGGLDYIKGFDFFLKIIEMLNQRLPLIPILIVSNGTGISKLVRIFKSKKKSLNITYLEKVDPIDPIYLKSKVYVIPSRSEGMPTTVLEAMKFNTPVVASNIMGNSEIIKDGYNGFLFDCNDIKEAVDKIEILLKNPTLVKKFTENSKFLLQKRHNWKSIVKKNIKVYQKVLSKN